MRTIGFLIAAALLLISVAAYAFTFNVTGTVTATVVTATGGTCQAMVPPAILVFPVAQGTQICSVVPVPANWTGTVTVDDTTHFQTAQINGTWWLEAGAASPPAGPFSVNLTETP